MALSRPPSTWKICAGTMMRTMRTSSSPASPVKPGTTWGTSQGAATHMAAVAARMRVAMKVLMTLKACQPWSSSPRAR